jgi:predicted nucleotidyltransferase
MMRGGEYMQSGVYSIEELKTLLAPAFGAYPVRRGYVFGSYSRGAATEKSDIDLFIEPLDGFKSYEVCGVLSRAMKLSGKDVDCYSSFDFDENAPIYKTILKDRVLIYGRE